MITEIEDYIRQGIIIHYRAKVAEEEVRDFYSDINSVRELVELWTRRVETGDNTTKDWKYMIETVNYAGMYTGERLRELEGWE